MKTCYFLQPHNRNCIKLAAHSTVAVSTMSRSVLFGVLAAFFFVTTAAFAGLFTWQYLAKSPSSNHTPGKDTDSGCPFYPSPQKINFDQKEFTDLFKWLDTYVASTVNETARPSVSANLVYLDEVVWSGYFGKKSKDGAETPNENTIYRIASISKIFPVLYLFKLWEDGKIDLYDPVTKYAPDFNISRPRGTEGDINLIDIASQISGLPGSLPFNPLSGSAIVYNGKLEDALALIQTQLLVSEPRSECYYSNLAYALLGHILARNFSADGSFTSWAQKNVVEPLDLTNTGFSYTQDLINKMATGYLPSGKPAPVYDLLWYGPAGNYYSTIADLTKISMSFMETSKTILKHETLTEMLRPRKTCRHGYFVNITSSPWEMNIIHDNLVVGKDGDLEGYSSTMAMVPDLKLGFNVLMSGTRGENVARKVMEKAIPVFREALRRMEQQVNPTPDPLKYMGVFSFYGLQEQTITIGPDGVLLMVNPKEPVPRYNTTGLSYVSDDVFQLRLQGGEFPCVGNLDKQNGVYIHFKNFTNGRYNQFDIPELYTYGFKRIGRR